MNYGKLILNGFKVLLAAVAGAAVYFSVDKAGKKSQSNKPFEKREECTTTTSFDCNEGNQQVVVRNNEGTDIVKGLKNVQESCGKLFAFMQSLTMVADNFLKIFRGDNSYIGQPYYNNPWGGYQQPVNMENGVFWNRISPYIVEASSDPRYCGRL